MLPAFGRASPWLGAVLVLLVQGFAAQRSNPCNDYSLHDCDPLAECYSEQPGFFQCRCPKGFMDLSPDKKHPGRRCARESNECALGTHECDPNAECLKTKTGYTCRCNAGFSDSSVDKLHYPGRSCKQAQSCLNSDCAPEAECHPSASGFTCQCGSGFVDVSRQHGRPAGRVCKSVVNECLENKHDCSMNASCINTADSFTCRCKDGFRDDSQNQLDRPGRICTKTELPPIPECNVNDPMSCDKTKLEVCLFRSGNYICDCPSGYGRLPDGRCLVINECQDNRLNNCSPDADCIDQAEGFTCQCKTGFADISPDGQVGRICKKRVNECNSPREYNVDCDSNAVCVDTDDGFSCRCRPGFADISELFNRLPGRKCVEAVNECLDDKLNDCSEHALCEDTKEAYLCSCKSGFIDASSNITHYPGRVCVKPNDNTLELHEGFSHDSCDINFPKCGQNEQCTDQKIKGETVCDCAPGYFRYQDGSCRLISACESLNTCDKNAICVNVLDSYDCQCRPGYFDVSFDSETEPGRKCKELVNECATNLHDCSPFADCLDATNGYACQCTDGFVDTSSQFGLLPGRKCSNASNECIDKSLNTCDENADCIDTPESYTCQCIPGYIDVSSSARLPPGRVCTVQTTCPKQKTDLVFLVDGSGSIGSYVFKHEVLRFVREFVELFEIGLDKTRVGFIQYSDQIRHEFDLNQYTNKDDLLKAITSTQYLTGLTRTGAAIQHMVVEGFSERRGARPISKAVSRVAIVITDGRSQDNVTRPALDARNVNVNMFAIGVTDHVLASELESIAGAPNRWFYVDRFKDLDTRLRSLIQKAACPTPEPEQKATGKCSALTQVGCNRALNEICVEDKDGSKCKCENGFQRHPFTHVCGGDLCNPQVPTSCPNQELCEKTYYGNHRCVCPPNFARDVRSGVCLSTKEKPQKPLEILPSTDCQSNGCFGENEECRKSFGGQYECECGLGFERDPHSDKCVVPGSCDPMSPIPCDVRKNEKCLLHSSGRYHTCQCSSTDKRHPVTDICLRNECLIGEHDCDLNARCIDTDDSYLCSCPSGFMDKSIDPVRRPGRHCVAERNECLEGTHNCSPDAICTDTSESFVCRCKPGFIDYSPNPHIAPGLVCRKLINECSRPELNTCHPNAQCIDTADSYKCRCKAGFVDLDELRNPGRNCERVHHNEVCSSGRHTCDKNARCFAQGDDDFTCSCPAGFKDKSPDPVRQPGRVCIPLIPECDNPSLNDCDSPDRAICTDTDEGYLCRCRQGFLDISPNIGSKPGRLCKKLENECVSGNHDCSRNGGICEDTPDGYNCRCGINYLDVSPDRRNRPGRNCKRLVDECSTGQNDCSPEAICTDTEDSYVCACPANFIDVSPDTVNKPGRRCLKVVNECTENKHDCSPNANCIDTPDAFRCECRDDFVDESVDPTRPGRICRPALVDECRLGKHDCHQDAVCQDLPQGYTCQCKPHFLDESPHRITHPGRLCVPRPTPKPAECRLDSTESCRLELNEVCRIINGEPKCDCPMNYQRDSQSKSCTVIDECLYPQLNDCHPSAECVDRMNGYDCKCRVGFKDLNPSKPGRSCRPLVNECQFPHLNDCHVNAQCTDKEEGYECKCNAGYKDRSLQLPGRSCQLMINECEKPGLNSCDKNAICTDLEDGYECQCRNGFYDVSPSMTLPGRACRQLINECASDRTNDCDRSATCTDTKDSYTCQCPPNSKDISPNPAFPGRVCLVLENECATGKHDCDPNAVCHDNEQSFTCECPDGFTDRSPNKLSRPGRYCVQLVDECATGRHTCSPQATCRDLEEGYTCECKDGYVDRSPNLLTQPGRVCGTPEVCPSNHECSSAATCEPLGGNDYKCTCIQGYLDQSPQNTEGRICVRNNACRDPRFNNCSRNAICYDEPKGYRCECIRGFVDKSPAGSQKGRVCEPPPPPPPPPRHPCQDPALNDCHSTGTCRATGPTSYTCQCLSGYEDRSPDVRNKPGRVCVLTEPVCLDSNKNDCHPAAICSERQGGDGYTCRCRDGYVDQSPDKVGRPGRICVEQVNECLDRSLNDCDPLAVCEDLPEGYTCRCPLTSIDQSPDRNRPGRKCFAQVNECLNPSLNNCSRFATCIDKPNGYECRCKEGYHDSNPRQPGTTCHYIINECESPNLNDCDKHATCIDLAGGYTCKCNSPYQDEGTAELPGRICKFNECLSKSTNKCDKNADCQDTAESYYCTCRDGFYDQSPNPLEPGRVCVEFKLDDEPRHVSVKPVEILPSKDVTPCGQQHYCSRTLNEVCVGGTTCECKPGEARRSPGSRCQAVDETELTFRVVSQGQRPLFYSSEYGSSTNEAYVEVTKEFQQDIGRAVGGTSYAPRYVTTDVKYITHPKTLNSSWNDGIIFEASIDTIASKNKVDKCDLWKQMMDSITRTNGQIGGGRLQVADDIYLLDPCYEQPIGDHCGSHQCNSQLGEVCIGDAVCGCINGEKRASLKDKCRPVEHWTVPLWVIRRHQKNLVYNESFSNPLDAVYRYYSRDFESGVGQSYLHTPLSNAFVTAEVNEIMDPGRVNASWDMGILYNCTMYFRKGAVENPQDVYRMLVEYIINRNNYQVGQSGLYLNPYQPDPFSACYQNTCHPKGICVETGLHSYRCECSSGYRDLNPIDPGRRCLPNHGYNECERPEDNECSENARCIDLDHLYKCECNLGFTDAAPKGSIPGSVCVLDYCSDVSYCPTNSTCVNLEQQAECECNNGFVDIRRSESRMSMGMSADTLCLSLRDVDECALGLTNCSGVAECTNLLLGYSCKCPKNFIDGNPAEPGTICAALLCDMCNQHGDCVHNALTKNVTCECADGWSGEFCEAAASSSKLVLFILCAILFLLLTLCILLYSCSKCHCFKRYADAIGYRPGPFWNTLEHSTSSESGADFSAFSAAGDLYHHDLGIPRAKLKSSGSAHHVMDSSGQEMSAHALHDYLGDGLRIPRAHLGDTSSLGSGSSEYTIREEIERRVVTDITTTELTTKIEEEAGGEQVIETTETQRHGGESSRSEAMKSSEGARSTTYQSSSSNVVMRQDATDEQERGESVAEFSNGHTKEWRSQYKSGDYKHMQL
ncbi:unnamed protein product [Bursaphelenchus okinawaensis]|uniref:Transmembrane cell adhesion receptor mua-3 n=1 Tax=Bursaphelenchus okinawaensis TaxID=465554 RepID=A0A811KIT5_9BILA|nr:unnamed protein product [Bursaphelenchus okinawaensis]CAG9104063.1 unnamed protein product [Bursaphelenchus okinawaensis]